MRRFAANAGFGELVIAAITVAVAIQVIDVDADHTDHAVDVGGAVPTAAAAVDVAGDRDTTVRVVRVAPTLLLGRRGWLGWVDVSTHHLDARNRFTRHDSADQLASTNDTVAKADSIDLHLNACSSSLLDPDGPLVE